MMAQRQPDYFAGDLFGEIYQAQAEAPPKRALGDYVPGLLLCGTASAAAAWLAEHYGFPIILLGLLIGLALSFVSEVERTAPGLDFASKQFLRFGIVILGLQVTFAQVAALGLPAFLGLLAIMSVTFAAGVVSAKGVRQKREAGILAGGATAICGASAALALYGVIGKERLDQARFSVTLVGVAVASAIAMSAYPALAGVLDLSDTQAGYLIGASVHDVAQAIGGGFSFSDTAGSSATVVKLARVALLAPVVALVALWIGSPGEDAAQPVWKRLTLPWFIAGFLVLLTVNSFISIPQPVSEWGLTISKAMLLFAVTATAMRSRLGLLLKAGWLSLVPVVAASTASFLAALVVALTLIS